jgi:pilus assembly protein CpaE
MLTPVLLVGTNQEDIARLADQLDTIEGIHLRSILFEECSNGMLRRPYSEADLIILCCRSHCLKLLSAIDALANTDRRPILVCGDLSSAEETKLLVRIGVEDLLSSTPSTEELQQAVTAALRNHKPILSPQPEATVVTVLGAAGGVGASMIACNLAHMFQAEAQKPTLLIDLDRICTPIASMLGLRSSRGLDEAITNLVTLDAIALDGYSARHDSGLQLLASVADESLPAPVSGSDFSRLLTIARDRFELIVIAANRWLDEPSIEAVLQSQLLLVVMRPELADLRATKMLRTILTETLGIYEDSMRIVVNRYSPRDTIQRQSVLKAIGSKSEPFMIPEDRSLVSRSIDAGSPLTEIARDAATTRAIMQLASSIVGKPIKTPARTFERFWISLSRGEKHA